MAPFLRDALAFSRSRSIPVDRPALDEIELLSVELAEHAGREERLDQPGESAARLPGSLDPYHALVTHWFNDEAGYGALLGIDFREHAARLRFLDASLDLLLPSREPECKANDGTGASSSL